jgi:hypothetical protein
MYGECDLCSEHTLECICEIADAYIKGAKMTEPQRISIEEAFEMILHQMTNIKEEVFDLRSDLDDLTTALEALIIQEKIEKN